MGIAEIKEPHGPADAHECNSSLFFRVTLLGRYNSFYKTNDNYRVIDLKIVFKFTEGDVTFADTKEGGIVSLRIATSMDQIGGGHMVNSAGQKGMDNAQILLPDVGGYGEAPIKAASNTKPSG